MNDMQKKVLIAVGVIVLGMLLYPPYRVYGFGHTANSLMDTGYALIFELPDRATVDVGTFTRSVGGYVNSWWHCFLSSERQIVQLKYWLCEQ